MLRDAIRAIASYSERARQIGIPSLFVKLLVDLRTTTRYAFIGPQGPLIRNHFDTARKIPGAFNLDDAHHFLLLLKLQTQYGIQGPILEIGSYHGRSASIISLGLQSGETFVICDAFQESTSDHYMNKPLPEILVQNIRDVNPDIDVGQLEIHPVPSDELALDDSYQFRLVHIDGGHSAEQTIRDLNLARRHLHPRGLIVVDDYAHPAWPGVQEGVDTFLSDNSDYSALMELNRHGAYGRKIVIAPDLSLEH